MDLNIIEFNPKEIELRNLADKYKALTIGGIEDKKGYADVHNARIELKNTRVQIQKDAKKLREDAVAFQKAVINKEKELIGLIEPVEDELANKQKAIDEEVEKIKRLKFLPERKQKLTEIQINNISDDFVLAMNDVQFNTYLNEQKSLFLAEQERKIREQQQAIEDEKRKIIEEQNRIKAEQERKIEIEKAEEKARLETEARIKFEQEQAIIAEQKKQKEIEQKKKYQDFLKENGYNEDNKNEFIVKNLEGEIVLYKKIASIKL